MYITYKNVKKILVCFKRLNPELLEVITECSLRNANFILTQILLITLIVTGPSIRKASTIKGNIIYNSKFESVV